LVQAFLKKWWVESDFKAPNLPLSLRLKGYVNQIVSVLTCLCCIACVNEIVSVLTCLCCITYVNQIVSVLKAVLSRFHVFSATSLSKDAVLDRILLFWFQHWVGFLVWQAPYKKYIVLLYQGRIQDFKLGGGAHLKKLRWAERGTKFLGYFVWKITILRQKKSHFFAIWGGACAGCAAPWIRPCISCKMIKNRTM
jgi:hypothetical protein